MKFCLNAKEKVLPEVSQNRVVKRSARESNSLPLSKILHSLNPNMQNHTHPNWYTHLFKTLNWVCTEHSSRHWDYVSKHVEFILIWSCVHSFTQVFTGCLQYAGLYSKCKGWGKKQHTQKSLSSRSWHFRRANSNKRDKQVTNETKMTVINARKKASSKGGFTARVVCN